MVSDCGKTVTKILNGGGGLSLDLINGASQLFPHAAIFSAYGMCSLPVSTADSSESCIMRINLLAPFAGLNFG